MSLQRCYGIQSSTNLLGQACGEITTSNAQSRNGISYTNKRVPPSPSCNSSPTASLYSNTFLFVLINQPHHQRTSPGRQQGTTLEMSKGPVAGDFTHNDVQDILEAAHLEVGRRYADTPYLCNILHLQLQEGIENCNAQTSDPMQLLHEQMRGERRVLDGYNKHRLGKASHVYYKNVPEAEDSVDYNEADNIPETLEWFPLRNEVAKRGFKIVANPIYQVPGTVEHDQATTMYPGLKNNSPPKKADEDTPWSIEKKIGCAAVNYDKLADAPSAYLDFPDGNITLVEMMAFLPQSIKSWDIIDRLLFNGAMSVTLAGMINHFRDMPNGPINNNSVYRMMKGPMEKRAVNDSTYKGWSVSAHQNLQKPNGFDPCSVSVDGFRTPVNYNKREAAVAAKGPTPTILFRDLINGVKIMPSGTEALDLTRCVQYCLNHPGEDWYYPQDFEELVSQLPQDAHLSGHPDGPAPVHPENQDEFLVRKYTLNKQLVNAKKNFTRQRDSHGRLLQKHNNSDEDGDAMDVDSDARDSKRAKVKHAVFIHTDSEALDRKRVEGKRADSMDIDSEGLDRKRAKGKQPGSDVSEDDTLYAPRIAKRRKVSHRTSSRGKASRRSTVPAARLRDPVISDDSDAGSDDDSSQVAEKKNTTVPTRTSERTKQFVGSYNLDSDSDSDYDSFEEDSEDEFKDYSEEEIKVRFTTVVTRPSVSLLPMG